jgi:hypothetical protein
VSKYEGQGGITVWAAISYDGPAAIKILDKRLDSDGYLDILKKKSRENRRTEGWMAAVSA